MAYQVGLRLPRESTRPAEVRNRNYRVQPADAVVIDQHTKSLEEVLPSPPPSSSAKEVYLEDL
jgi:hypothetical protein